MLEAGKLSGSSALHSGLHLKGTSQNLSNSQGAHGIFKIKFILGGSSSGELEIALGETNKQTKNPATKNLCEAFLKSCVY